MSLQNLKSKTGRIKRKRVGRGNGSGHGTFSGRGVKGQTARAGGRRRPGFEGGQTPYLRRMPKLKGFRNPNRTEYQIINLGDLNIFEEKENIDTAALIAKNLISKKDKPVKLLAGKGALTKTLTITVDRASKSAIEAVEARKGKCIVKAASPVKTEEAVTTEK